VKYTVQPGDTPMGITQKFLGNPTRVGDLVRVNPHKTSLWVGHTLTFREMFAGEQLEIPKYWNAHSRAGLGTSGCPSGHYRDASGNCVPDTTRPQHQYAHHGGVRGMGDAPSFEVAPRADPPAEPILTVSGPSSKVPCCARCGQTGGSCAGEQNTIANPCSQPQAPPSIPGSTSFPVGFGRGVGQGPITTQVPAVAVVSSWAVPLAIGLVSAAAGFGLAYWIAGND